MTGRYTENWDSRRSSHAHHGRQINAKLRLQQIFRKESKAANNGCFISMSIYVCCGGSCLITHYVDVLTTSQLFIHRSRYIQQPAKHMYLKPALTSTLAKTDKILQKLAGYLVMFIAQIWKHSNEYNPGFGLPADLARVIHSSPYSIHRTSCTRSMYAALK